MGLEIRVESVESLGAHMGISIAFQVEKVLEVLIDKSGIQGMALRERPVTVPYLKDNDTIFADDPTSWSKRFDLTNWGVIAAYQDAMRVGGAVIAFNTANLWMLDGRSDLASLWDLRVRTEERGRGVGTALFRATEAWAETRGCSQLKIETQNTNVPACHFYVRMGCTLGGINRYAYSDLPDETRLLWFKDL